MAAYDTSETAQLSVSSTDAFATFGIPGGVGAGGINQVYLVTSTDCYIDFDQPAVTTRSLLLKANLAPVRIDLRGGTVTQVHAITSGATGTLYILGVRN